MITVAQLFTYPLKGGRAVAATSLELDAFGPAGDRRWMVIDPDGEQITQRDAPRLCLLEARRTDTGLRLAAGDEDPLDVPLVADRRSARRIHIWRDHCDAIDQGDDAAAWIGRWLDRPCRLVHMPDETHRPTDPAYDRLGGRVSFADGYPLLVTGTASLRALNQRLAEPVPMSRFRPNIVVAGAGPFDEDTWRRFRVGDVRADGVKPCARCQVTTIDQDTGATGREPLATLARFRKGASGALFGVNAVHRDRGIIRIGDTVAVETRGPAPIV